MLIYGCNDSANVFLYMDPWGGESTLKYEGGMGSINRPDKCAYMGKFSSMYDADRLLSGGIPGNENVLRQTLDSQGTFKYAAGNYLEIITGP